MSDPLTVPAFAKINWILKILGKRPDGFHEIRTVLQTVELHDLLHIEIVVGRGISLEVTGADLPGTAKNLVWRSAEAFRSQTGSTGHFHFELVKRIPIGAGLGGGSSDAAITLLALNSMFGHPLSFWELVRLAATLGSDVPFFLWGGTVLASGRGELLKPWQDVVPCRFFLCYPGLQISAEKAYLLGCWPPLGDVPELTKSEVDNRIQRFHGRIKHSLPVQDLVENDFDGPLFERYPELRGVRAWLGQAGCKEVVVCGSGSSILGIPQAGQFETVQTKMQCWEVGTVLPGQTISRSEYQRRLVKSGLTRTESERP